MPSLRELVDEVVTALYGVVDQPAMGTLMEPLTTSSTSFVVDFGTLGTSRPNGIIEVDSELMLVTAYDAQTSRVTVAPWSRGHQGSTAATHVAGAQVTVRPRFPRYRVRSVLNEVIRSSCPPLFAVRDLAPIDTGLQIPLGYALPADLIRVLRVDEVDSGVSEFVTDRRIYRHWAVRDVAGQKLLEVSKHQTLQTLQVTCAVEPGQLVADADDFAAVTGLHPGCADMVVFGALSRLVMNAELSRQQLNSVEANMRAASVPAGSGLQLSRYYQALYTQRLQAEQDRLNQMHPIVLRRGWPA